MSTDTVPEVELDITDMDAILAVETETREYTEGVEMLVEMDRQQVHLERLLAYGDRVTGHLQLLTTHGLSQSMYAFMAEDLGINISPEVLTEEGDPGSDVTIAATEDLKERLQKIWEWVKETVTKMWQFFVKLMDRLRDIFSALPTRVAAMLERLRKCNPDMDKFGAITKKMPNKAEFDGLVKDTTYAAITLKKFVQDYYNNAKAGKWLGTKGADIGTVFHTAKDGSTTPFALRDAMEKLGFAFSVKNGRPSVKGPSNRLKFKSRSMKDLRWTKDTIVSAHIAELVAMVKANLLGEVDKTIRESHKLLLTYAKRTLLGQSNSATPYVRYDAENRSFDSGTKYEGPGSFEMWAMNTVVLAFFRSLIRTLMSMVTRLIRMWLSAGFAMLSTDPSMYAKDKEEKPSSSSSSPSHNYAALPA